jgi:hypothetical protein
MRPTVAGQAEKGYAAEIAVAGPVIDIDELNDVIKELDMLESPMRARKTPQRPFDLVVSDSDDELA